jgi:DNA-binding LacI/PurR family transcriptional regulator
MDDSTPKHIYAERKIREAICHLKVDDKIPGERVIAKELGVSYMTARKAVESLVAKGVLYKVPKKGTYVADQKKTAKKTKNIGYFLDSSIKDGLASPYYSMIFDALEKEATKNGYALVYFTNGKGTDYLEILKKVDGVIISCFPRIEPIIREINKRVPVVCIDNSLPDKSIASVTLDNFNSVVDSIDYLCTQGHKRIGFITGLDDSDIGRDRLCGYISALKSHGISEDMDLIFRGDYSFATGKKGADYFLSLDNPPTAVMCANDTMAISAIKEIIRRGFRVPEDISIIGFDDITIASQITPALSTVSVPVEDIAKKAITMLRAAMDEDETIYQHAVLPCQLVLRDSSASKKEKRVAVGG